MLLFTSICIKNMIVSGHDLGKIKQAPPLEKAARPQCFPQLRPRKYCGPRGNTTVLIIMAGSQGLGTTEFISLVEIDIDRGLNFPILTGI